MFIERLNQLLKERNLTRSKFLSDLNMGKNQFKYWETRGTPNAATISAIANYFGVSEEYLVGNAENSHKKNNTGVKIPVFGTVAAGIPISAIEDIIDYEEIDEQTANSGEYFALKIKGDSMEPRMTSGDVVIVRSQSTIESGDIAIVLINGEEATCKKIKQTPEGIMLISLNPAYEPMFYSKKQIKELPVRILGKVVELRAKFN